jgi:predicted alpha-1,2-mannosidase
MLRCTVAVFVGTFLFCALLPSSVRAATPAPTLLVNTFIGTSGTPQGGPIDTFPGADVPFGMVQWSPDTGTEDAGGGYDYGDRSTSGFSLTHLSGPGCNVFGDFAILPTTGDVGDPSSARQPFTHQAEQAAPGWYAVSVGDPGIRSELSVTPRTGLGRFTYPSTTQANLLFNASSNQAGVTDASIRITGSQEISGSASSGFFCGMPDRYTVYFVAQFDRSFSGYGTWKGSQINPGSNATQGPGSGGWVTFDASHNPGVRVKVGLSFVSIDGARANLRAENPGWEIDHVRDVATGMWNGMLERIAVEGGTSDERQTFYTALYHALLHPNLISDADGRYTGFDGRVHNAAPGHNEYANFSDWDIYRTEVPLLALVAPGETSDMMQSLVDAAKQENGWLPRWALVNGPTSVMGGDSPDAVIAGAYAFGARAFDTKGALAAMVQGASTTNGTPGQGWYVSRWELNDAYLQQGHVVNTHTTSVSPVPNGASETLEYAIDDFSIARFAQAIGNAATFRTFIARSANWSTLFDSATRSIAPRDPTGAFMQTSITDNGQSGFQEGNAAQYTWMVPQDLRDLIAGMGGNAAAVTALDALFAQLNAGEDKPYAWMGNEPSLGIPWVYLSAGEPWRAQEIVRTTLTTLYNNTPAGIPGNDDLGTMSAWYVWNALGLYPQNPSVRGFDIGTPLFARAILRSPNGPTIEIDAPQASDESAYVQNLRANGATTQQTWLALPMQGLTHLEYTLSANPNKSWGIAPDNAPPSYGPGPIGFPVSTGATLGAAKSAVTLAPGQATPLSFTIANPAGSGTVANVTWHPLLPAGLHLAPEGGVESVAAGASVTVSATLFADPSVKAGYYNIPIAATAGSGALLQPLVTIARIARSDEPLFLAYAENRFGNTVTPVDVNTGQIGPEIKVGNEPRDAALSLDGARVYVADRGSQSISVIDTAKQAVTATVRVGNSPNGLALSPDGSTLWVANADDNTVQSIDVATLRASGIIRVGVSPHSIAIAPDGSTIYVTDQGSNAVTPIDVKTRAPGTPIPVGARPAGIAITADGKRLYVVDNASNDVTPIDLAAHAALKPIPVGVSPMLIAIAPNAALAYVTNYANSTITPLDLATNAALAPIVVGGAPYGIAFDSDGKSAIVVNRRDNDCVFVDVATGHVGKPILLGNGPYTIVAP